MLRVLAVTPSTCRLLGSAVCECVRVCVLLLFLFPFFWVSWSLQPASFQSWLRGFLGQVMPNEYDHQLALEGAGGKGGWQGLGRWASYSCSGC